MGRTFSYAFLPFLPPSLEPEHGKNAGLIIKIILFFSLFFQVDVTSQMLDVLLWTPAFANDYKQSHCTDNGVGSLTNILGAFCVVVAFLEFL